MLAAQNATATRSEFVGKQFGRLRVTDVVLVDKKLLLLCQCVCGNSAHAAPHQLRSGDKKSCGCLKRSVLGDRTRTHGRANSRLTGYADRAYGVWQAMRDRCGNPNRADYRRYGGRGIGVCKRWDVFENFLLDMGEPPAGLTLERKNNDKGYYKRNCVWATRKQQAHNSTHMRWITHEGKKMYLSQWQKALHVKTHTYYSRINRGWSVKEALGLVTRK